MQGGKKVWFADRRKVLDKFQKEAYAGSWHKMLYPLWRELSNITRYSSNVLKITKESSSCISVKITSCGTETTQFETTFFIGDKSFGDFLETNWRSPALTNPSIEDALEATKNMTTTNYTTSATTGQTISSGGLTIDGSNIYSTTTVPYSNVIADNYTFYYNGKTIDEHCKDIIDEYMKEKDKEKKMDTSNMFNFDFGPVSGNQFRMSPYGLAIQTSNNGWVSYNAKAGDLMKVDIINFDMSKLIYKMPVPFASVQPGDIVIHAKKPVFVRSINQDGTISVIDYTNAEVSNILPVKSPFGFNFFTKVCALVDFSNMGATSDNPFGNMLPFLMMNNNKGEVDTAMLLAMSMMNGDGMDFSKNPMMMYLLMSGKDKGDMLPFVLMMMNGNAWGTASATPVTQ